MSPSWKHPGTFNFLTMYLFSLLVILFSSSSNAQGIRNITFGQSAAFTGISGDLGTQMRKGIEAAFHVINMEGLAHPVLSACPDTNSLGVQLQLIAYDDQYEEAPAIINTRRLIDEDNVFALLGSIGTPTTVAARPIAKEHSIPILGPVTGSMSLREPYDPYIVNIRASYNDETAAMVQYLTEQLGIAKISIFYQNDSFGMAGFSGLSLALSYAGLTLESMGTFTRNSLAVEAGLANITLGRPQAVVMIGTYGPLAKFVKLAKEVPSLRDAYFLTVSFVGSEGFIKELNGVYDKIIVTQVVPLPFDDSLLMVKNYHKAMMNYSLSKGEVFDPAVNSTFFGLEGYMLGTFVSVALQRTEYNLSVPNFLDAIYETAIFSLGGLRLGPYGPDCAQSFTGCRCNQGMHEVFITAISEAGKYYQIPGTQFTFSTCGYTPPVNLPIAFGQSQKYTPILNATEQDQFRNGIRGAFAEFNKAQTFPRSVLLVTFSNSSMEDNSDYASELVSRGAFALLGDTGHYNNVNNDSALYSSMNIPTIGMMSGSMALREGNSTYAINIRASYNDEAAAAIAYVTRNNFTNVALFYEDNSQWAAEGVKAISLATASVELELALNTSFWTNDDTVNYADSNTLTLLRNVEVVLIAATNAIATTNLITTIRNYANPNFVCLSTVSIGQMQAALVARYPPTTSSNGNSNDNSNASSLVEAITASFNNVHFTQPTPSVNDESSPLVLAYHAAMSESFPGGYIPSQISLEGYLVGRFTSIAISRVDSTISASSFINAIYSSSTFQVNEITLGPFSADSESLCNQGARDVFFLKLGSNGQIQADPTNNFHMTTCGVDYTSLEAIVIDNPMAVRWVFVAIAFVVILIALFGVGLTIIGRKMKVVRVKSEVYCYLVCCGVIIAVSSVIVKGWKTDGQAERDRQCMAGAWTMLIGYALTMSCLLASSVEIFSNFKRGVEPTKVKLSNLKVGAIVGGVSCIALFLIILYTAIDPLKSTLKFSNSNGYYHTCTSKHTGSWMAAIYTIMGTMGAINAIISFLTRGYQAPYISVFIGYSVYNALFLAVVILPLRLLVVEDQVAAFVLESIGFLFGACFTLITTLGIPYYTEFFGMSNMLKSKKITRVWSEESASSASAASSLASSSSSVLNRSTSGLINSNSLSSTSEVAMLDRTTVEVKSIDD